MFRGGSPASGNAAITGGTGVAIKLAVFGLPLISAPTGTMANNGAVTLGTALDRIYANCYLFFPAGAVAAGVPAAAAWLFVQMSSTTVGTVFNNTYSGTGVPTIPASPTAFVTTGPGAFTGDTSEQGALITVPANALGTGGKLIPTLVGNNNNSAGAKTFRIRYSGAAGTQYIGSSQTTITGSVCSAGIWSAGATNAQVGFGRNDTNGGAYALTEPQTSSVDTTAATSVFLSIQKAVATDFAVIQAGDLEFIA